MTLVAFVAAVASAQAAAITWGLGADIYLLEEGKDFSTAKVAYETTLVPESGSYLALVYVGQNQDSFDIANITSASVVDTLAYGLDTDGSTYADWDPYQKTSTAPASTYADGASFGVVWFDAGSSQFRYIQAIDDGANLNQTVTFADMTRGSDSIMPASNTNYGGVLTVSVPEPGIACMALLGIGMMLKRRRA